MSDPTPIDRAVAAVCEAIVDQVERPATANLDPEQIGKLAHAVSELMHGPQGGTYASESDGTSSTDYHYTEHDRQGPPKAPAGFSAPPRDPGKPSA